MHDPWVFGLALLLTVLGIFFVFDAGYARSLAKDRGFIPREFVVQLISLFAALLVAAFVARQRARTWKGLAVPLFALSFITMLMLKIPGIGIEMNGSTRWLGSGSFTIQPSEFAKVAAVLFLAAMMSGRKAWPRRRYKSFVSMMDATLWPKLRRATPLAWVLAGAALIALEPDLGTGAVVGAVAVLMVYVAGVTRTSLLVLAGLVGFAAWGFVILEPYRLDRVADHLHRWDSANIDDTGYQTVQAEIGMASGGWTGVGIGAGRAKHVMPAATTDFITATIGEEFGLVGSLALLSLVIALALRLLMLAKTAHDEFGKLVLVGVAAWLGVQACVNVMMANGLLPAIGIPLPFISSGGSSLIALWIAIGLCQSVLAPVPVEEAEREASGNRWRNRRTRLSRA